VSPRSLRPFRLLLPVALVSIALVLAGCGSGSSTAALRPPKYYQGTPLNQSLPAALRKAPFTDSSGRTVHLSDFAGKVVVIQDSMTLCQEACPIDTAALVAAARHYTATASDPDDVVFLTITVDPQRDDPAQLAAYRRQYVGATSQLPQWQLWTGSPAVVSALWKHLGVWVKKVPQDDVVHNWRTGAKLTYDVDHSDQVFFFDGRLHERYILDGMPSIAKGTDRGTIPKRILGFTSDEGRANAEKMKGWTAPQADGVLAWITQLA
jgi:cytochrome oxidase Cu insertion factor (SCO1/SenC/PrrC family)